MDTSRITEYANMSSNERMTKFRPWLTTDGFITIIPCGPLDVMLGEAHCLLDKSLTRSSQVTQDALQIYYKNNFFNVRGHKPLQQFLQPRTNTWHDPDNGFHPTQHVRKLVLVIPNLQEAQEIPAFWGDWSEWMDRTAPQKWDITGINAARKVLF